MDTTQYTIQDVRKRFESTPELGEFLPMLDEYIFQDSRIKWLCTASAEKVFRFCADTDE